MIYIVHYTQSNKNEVMEYLTKRMGSSNNILYDTLFLKMMNPLIMYHNSHKPDPIPEVIKAFKDNFKLKYETEEYIEKLNSYYEMINYTKLSSMYNTKEKITEVVELENFKSPKCIEFYIYHLKERFKFRNAAVFISEEQFNIFKIFLNFIENDEAFGSVYSSDITQLDENVKNKINFLLSKPKNTNTMRYRKHKLELTTVI